MNQEDTHQDDRSRIEKVKQHLKENKKVYLAAVGSSVATLLVVKHPVVSQSIRNTALIVWKPESTNVAITQLARRGHPGYMIQCVDTGETFASIRRAAEALGVNRVELYKHLKGDLESAGGHIFKNLGEMK